MLLSRVTLLGCSELSIKVKKRVDNTCTALQSSVPQNIRQANAAFEALLDILQHQITHATALHLPESYADEARLYFEGMAKQALSLGDCLF